MNPKVIALLQKYDEFLSGFGVPPLRSKGYVGGGKDTIAHLRWMIAEMLAQADGWSVRKTNRWLGFIQGTMWATGSTSLVVLRDQSRHLYDADE